MVMAASDNALVTQFIDPTLGCAPYQNPCTTCPSGQGPALATDVCNVLSLHYSFLMFRNAGASG